MQRNETHIERYAQKRAFEWYRLRFVLVRIELPVFVRFRKRLEKKKRRFLSKVTVGLSGFLQLYAVKSAIYIRAQIYIYTLWRGKSRKRRGDDGGNDEREEEEGWAERRVGFNREVR